MTEHNFENTKYKVVVNNEGQYSIWILSKKTPNGWDDVGFTGERDECLNYISKVWKDMRPLSLK